MKIDLEIEELNVLIQSCEINILTLRNNLKEDRYVDRAERELDKLWLKETFSLKEKLEKIRVDFLK